MEGPDQGPKPGSASLSPCFSDTVGGCQPGAPQLAAS